MDKPPQDADLELFRQQVQDATPLRHDGVEHFRQRPAPIPRPRPTALLAQTSADIPSESQIDTPDYLLFARPGLQQRVLRELQRGAMRIGLEVDLHGLYAEHAQRLLGEFLTECSARRIRCARIIHGKGRGSDDGQPVLKRKVNYWLRLYPQVLAFCSATRQEGGTGAVFVLLRNPAKARRERHQ